MDPLIQELTKEQLRDDMPDFRAGDTVRVHVRVVEGTHERIQLFEGVVIKKKGTGIGATYTVRKIASGVGVEKSYLLHSPLVEKVEVVKRGKVRRNYLTFLRDRFGKSARLVSKKFDKSINDIGEAQAEADAEMKAEIKAEEAAEHKTVEK